MMDMKQQDVIDISQSKWINYQTQLKRYFSIQSFTDTELLTLPIHYLYQIKNCYQECYQQIFCNSNVRFWRTRMIKLKAIEYCQKTYQNHCSHASFQFKAFQLQELDDLPNSEILHSSYSLFQSLTDSEEIEENIDASDEAQEEVFSKSQSSMTNSPNRKSKTQKESC